jgi:hypothetical protein
MLHSSGPLCIISIIRVVINDKHTGLQVEVSGLDVDKL